MRQVNIGLFKINDVEIGSTVSINQSIQKRMYNNTKKNQGFGANGSDGSYFEVQNGSLDQDLADGYQFAQSTSNKRKGT